MPPGTHPYGAHTRPGVRTELRGLLLGIGFEVDDKNLCTPSCFLALILDFFPSPIFIYFSSTKQYIHKHLSTSVSPDLLDCLKKQITTTTTKHLGEVYKTSST